MVALLILLVGGLVAVGLWSWLAPRAGRRGSGDAPTRRPGSGDAPSRRPGRSGRDRSGPLGLRSARAIVEDREALEAEDLAQMLEAHNAWRRRRGRPERTVEDVELMVAGDAREARQRREAELAGSEIDQMIEATNARRRARGLPERDSAEVRRRYGAGEQG